MKKVKPWVAKRLRRWAEKLDPGFDKASADMCIQYSQHRVERVSVAYICPLGQCTFSPTQITYRLCDMLVKSLLEKGTILFSEESRPYGTHMYIATVYVATDVAEEIDHNDYHCK